jgi:arginine utilization regulatory protein
MVNFFDEKNLAIILDHVSDGIQMIDIEGRLVFCNRLAAMLDDISIENSLGRHLFEIYPSLDEESSTLYKVLRTGVPIYNHEQTFTTYKGKKVATVNTTLPVKKNGHLIGAMEISHDISAVMALSEKVVTLQNRMYGSRDTATSDDAHFTFDDIITRNTRMLAAKSMAMKAARIESSVMVWGDTGTGKELFVQAIHNASARKQRPFIAQNCAALPASLLEGILFGTVKGGFTGSTDRPGLFETADSGTLFLDEINSMPMELQGKLLRVLQDGTFRRVGDTRTRHVDVKLLTATNIEPFEAVERGMLRSDLYYRLNTITVYLPRLVERRDDIPLLIEHFIKKFNERLYLNVLGIDEAAFSAFMRYDWPGNVRELEHVIEGAMGIMEGREIGLEDLPQAMQRMTRPMLKPNAKDTAQVPYLDAMDALEARYINEAMHITSGNISRASELLGLPRQTLQYKLKRLKERETAENSAL